MRQHKLSVRVLSPVSCPNERANPGRVDELHAGKIEDNPKGVGVVGITQHTGQRLSGRYVQLADQHQHNVTVGLFPALDP